MGIRPLTNDQFGYESNCFVCEPANRQGLRIPFFHDDQRGVVTAEFRLPNDFSGAPTMIHGGVTLAILDEAMAWACIAIGRSWAVTTRTTTTFHRAVRVDRVYRVDAEIVDRSETRIDTVGRILDATGHLRAEAEATFTVLGEAQLKRAAGVDVDADVDPSLRLD